MFNGTAEKDICLRVARILADVLADQGHLIAMTRTDDAFISITSRANYANFVEAELFISLHINADSTSDRPAMSEIQGTEIRICPQTRQARMLADTIGREIVASLPDWPWRGIKEEDVEVLRFTTMPAVLIDMSFRDHSQTLTRMVDPDVQMKMARAIAHGVRDYLQPSNLAA